MANMNIEQMVEELSGWTVKDVASLVKALEDLPPTTLAIGEAYMLYDDGRLRLALPLLDAPEALDDGRFAADLLFVKAQLLKELDRPDEALATLEEALQHEPSAWLATRIEENIVELRP